MQESNSPDSNRIIKGNPSSLFPKSSRKFGRSSHTLLNPRTSKFGSNKFKFSTGAIRRTPVWAGWYPSIASVQNPWGNPGVPAPLSPSPLALPLSLPQPLRPTCAAGPTEARRGMAAVRLAAILSLPPRALSPWAPLFPSACLPLPSGTQRAPPPAPLLSTIPCSTPAPSASWSPPCCLRAGPAPPEAPPDRPST